MRHLGWTITAYLMVSLPGIPEDSGAVATQLLPAFSTKTQNIVKTQVGMSVVLHCYVDHASSHTVTWIRQSDLEILSAGALKITADPRINVIHNPRFEDWSIELVAVEKEDAGYYECQINMMPLKSLSVKLIVEDIPRTELGSRFVFPARVSQDTSSDIQDQSTGSSTEIQGAPDIYFHPGTLVNLTCIIISSVFPGRIFWYHEGKVISYYSSRNGVSIYRVRKENLVTVSSLLMRDGGLQDEGTYICRPEKEFLKSAEARLFIIDGTRSEARKSNGCTGTSELYTLLVINLTLNLYCNL